MDIECIGSDLQETLVELTGRSLQAKQLRLGEHPVTQDVLIGVQAGLEKQRWMFSAQQS